uniref:Uncharacterized protein n=1 Tax=Cannabis sativa TaxID=3483 RepID=A0A803QRL1_CANSA
VWFRVLVRVRGQLRPKSEPTLGFVKPRINIENPISVQSRLGLGLGFNLSFGPNLSPGSRPPKLLVCSRASYQIPISRSIPGLGLVWFTSRSPIFSFGLRSRRCDEVLGPRANAGSSLLLFGTWFRLGVVWVLVRVRGPSILSQIENNSQVFSKLEIKIRNPISGPCVVPFLVLGSWQGPRFKFQFA